MIDLMQDPDLGEVLRHFHTEAKTTAFLCHGPVALTAAIAGPGTHHRPKPVLRRSIRRPVGENAGCYRSSSALASG
jgi:putative intracellular protease/amidase